MKRKKNFKGRFLSNKLEKKKQDKKEKHEREKRNMRILGIKL